MIYTGVVKWYNPIRGFGFIVAEGCKEMIYADNQQLKGLFKPLLIVGTKVKFNLEKGNVDCRATDIVVIKQEFNP
ncbi:Cold shock-like protein CspD [compost metagenome]|uniref:cold shock domain-containing protein n=1 Tax=Pedobacter ghigonis TaxID=2730403 RepID=UPI000FA45B54|nr:cold shock domain-containing protein [Pedobacter ghigonis]